MDLLTQFCFQWDFLQTFAVNLASLYSFRTDSTIRNKQFFYLQKCFLFKQSGQNDKFYHIWCLCVCVCLCERVRMRVCEFSDLCFQTLCHPCTLRVIRHLPCVFQTAVILVKRTRITLWECLQKDKDVLFPKQRTSLLPVL